MNKDDKTRKFRRIKSPEECFHAVEDDCNCIVIKGLGKFQTWTKKYGWWTVE